MTTTDPRLANQPAEPIAAPPAGQRTSQATVAAEPNLRSPARLGPQPANDIAESKRAALAGHDSPGGHCRGETHAGIATGGQNTSQAIDLANTKVVSPARPDAPGGHSRSDTHGACAAGDTDSQRQARACPKPTLPAPAAGTDSQSATRHPKPTDAALAGGNGAGAGTSAAMHASESTEIAPLDPAPAPGAMEHLDLYSMTVTEAEKVRIASENRLRSVVREAEDRDGIVRPAACPVPPGFSPADGKIVQKLARAARDLKRCPPDWDPLVYSLARTAASQLATELAAIGGMEQALASSPLGPWVESVRGAGLKQVARLLGATGDPAIRPEIVRDDGTIEPARPRKLSELWAYCGHGDPARKRRKGMTRLDAEELGSAEAKARLRVIAMQMIKCNAAGEGYRAAYSQARERYADAVHMVQCQNTSRTRMSPNGCGTQADPGRGAPGSPWLDGHKHHAALRLVGKAFLRDLWREARRVRGLAE